MRTLQKRLVIPPVVVVLVLLMLHRESSSPAGPAASLAGPAPDRGAKRIMDVFDAPEKLADLQAKLDAADARLVAARAAANEVESRLRAKIEAISQQTHPSIAGAGTARLPGQEQQKRSIACAASGPYRIASMLRCDDSEGAGWLNTAPATAAECQAQVLAQPASKCSRSYFHWAELTDRNCGCIQPGSNCTDGDSLFGQFGTSTYEILRDAQHSSGHPKCQLDVYDDPVLSKLMLGTQSQPKVDRFTAEFEKSLAVMPELPRLLHLSWIDKAVIDSHDPFVLHGIANLTASNPDWSLRIWDDGEMNGYIKEHVAPHDWALVKDTHIVERSDLWRLLVIFHEGGYYQDLDRFYNRGPLSEIINPRTKMYLAMHSNINYAQDLLISAPQNPVYKLAISFNLKLRRLWREQGTSSYANAEDTVIALGPHGLFTAANFVMFGTALQRGVEEDVGERIRAALNANPYTQSKKETAESDHCDMVTFVKSQCSKMWGLKGSFLSSIKKKRWDEEVREKQQREEPNKRMET